MTIHKEGYVSLLLALAFVLVVNFLSYTFINISWLNTSILIFTMMIFLIVLQFFRHPHKTIELNENHIIAPADGKVVVIEEVVENEYLKTKCRQISIFMSPINVHVNRYPISGMIKYFKYHPGLYLVAWHPKSSTDNERTTTVIQGSKATILVRQIAGALARRIVWYVQEGATVEQGTELGFIKFGSRVDIFIPLSAEVTVSMDEVTVGGKTVIAKFA